MEERGFDITKAERIKNESDNVDKDHRCELFRGSKLELGYLDTCNEHGRHVEKQDCDEQLQEEE